MAGGDYDRGHQHGYNSERGSEPGLLAEDEGSANYWWGVAHGVAEAQEEKAAKKPRA